MESFFLMGAKPLVQGSPTPTMKLHELLDWAEIGYSSHSNCSVTPGRLSSWCNAA